MCRKVRKRTDMYNERCVKARQGNAASIQRFWSPLQIQRVPHEFRQIIRSVSSSAHGLLEQCASYARFDCGNAYRLIRKKNLTRGAWRVHYPQQGHLRVINHVAEARRPICFSVFLMLVFSRICVHTHTRPHARVLNEAEARCQEMPTGKRCREPFGRCFCVMP